MSGDIDKLLKDVEKKNQELAHINVDLENRVNARTLELREANATIKSMLNGLGQAFLVFGRNGVCYSAYSKACETILEQAPAGRAIWDVLHLSESEFKDTEVH